MNIELKEHNEIAYKKIKEHFTSFDRTCIVHCTGSGKSYVALKLIEDCIKNNSSVLFVTMSRELEKQFKNDQLAILYKIHRVDPEFLEKINQKLTITRYSALKKLGSKSAYDYIILDEFHRAGAKVTSKNIEKLLNNNQGAKILGVSATPIREKGRNMAEELFHGNLASKIDLYDAIEKHHIIPRPEYIACVYDEQTELRKLLDLFSLPKYAKIYEQPTSLITKARKALENGTVTGLEWIFERYMTNINAKYLVFCNNINHLKLLMKKAEDEWFNWSQYPVYTYYQHSKDNPRGKNYEAFVKSDKVGIKLMFCVNMFTTGVHSKNIDGIINFRSTKIVPLYLQIIGRTLTCGRNFANPPQIFDIVDNLETLRRRNPFSISFSKNTSISQLMEMHDLKQFDFYIESADQKIHNILEDLKKIIRTQLSWDEAYDIACEFYLKNGHLKVQKDTLINGFDLYGWLSYQRYLHNHPELNKLSQEKIKLLEDLKIDWNYSEYWDYFITQSLKIPIENGKRSITKSNCPVDSPLPKMLHNIRRAYRFGSLSKERISKLTELKIDLDPTDTNTIWDNHFSKVLDFQKKNNHIHIPSTGEYATQYRWLKQQHAEFNKSKSFLNQEQIYSLKKIGFIKGTSFEFMLKALEYKNNLTNDNLKSYNRWKYRQLDKKSKGQLTETEIRILDALPKAKNKMIIKSDEQKIQKW